MDETQRANAEIVLRQIKRLNARRSTYGGIGAIAGLICGLALGCTLFFIFNMSLKWIRLGPAGMVVGYIVGSLAAKIRRGDLATITAELNQVSGGPGSNAAAAKESNRSGDSLRGPSSGQP